MVGTGRFELPTPRTPSECSTRLSHVPTRSSRLTGAGLGSKSVYTSRGPCAACRQEHSEKNHATFFAHSPAEGLHCPPHANRRRFPPRRHHRFSAPPLVFTASPRFLFAGAARRAVPRQSLLIYAVDVEGGQATLLVSPSGASLLVDTGWPTGSDDFDDPGFPPPPLSGEPM